MLNCTAAPIWVVPFYNSLPILIPSMKHSKYTKKSFMSKWHFSKWPPYGVAHYSIHWKFDCGVAVMMKIGQTEISSVTKTETSRLLILLWSILNNSVKLLSRHRIWVYWYSAFRCAVKTHVSSSVPRKNYKNWNFLKIYQLRKTSKTIWVTFCRQVQISNIWQIGLSNVAILSTQVLGVKLKHFKKRTFGEFSS